MKSKVTINIESNLLAEARINNMNISQSTEETIRNKLMFLNGDISGINEQILEIELKKDEKELTKLQIKVAQQKELLAKIRMDRTKNEQARLEKEKERIEKAKRCHNCGNILSDKQKFHRFPKGNICNGCYLSCDKEQIRTWN